MTFSPKITGNIRIVLENPPPVVRPPLPVRVEYNSELTQKQAGLLTNEIEDKIHHLLRFRTRVEMVLPGILPVSTSATGKTNLLEKRYEKDA